MWGPIVLIWKQTRVRFPGFLPRVKCPLLLGAPSLPAGQLRCSACRLERTRGPGMLTSRWRMEVSSELERKLPAGPMLTENRRWGRGQQATCTSRFADGLPSDPLWQPWGAPAFSNPSSTGSLHQMTLASREINSVTFSQLTVTGEKIQS